LTEHEEEWENLAQGLLEYETLTGPEIRKVMNGEPLNRDDDEDDQDTTGTPSITSIPKASRPKKDTPPSGGDLEPEPT
ncbi:MAG: cell division protein FtsH, partial [Pseudomonadota bacterium]